ncbi:MAG: hypothetical protein ACI9VS_002193 [Candidatus Binatia bacterium]|jgi:hypothetical protein
MKKTLFSILVLAFVLNSAQALVALMPKLTSPENCPKHLQVTAKPDKKDTDFVTISVRFKPREYEPYIGRVKATFWLNLSHKGETLFRSGLSTKIAKDGFTTARFRIRKSALRESELTVSSHLFERDGTPTIGGAVIYEIPLKGWITPRDKAAKPEPAPGIEIELAPVPAIPGR